MICRQHHHDLRSVSLEIHPNFRTISRQPHLNFRTMSQQPHLNFRVAPYQPHQNLIPTPHRTSPKHRPLVPRQTTTRTQSLPIHLSLNPSLSINPCLDPHSPNLLSTSASLLWDQTQKHLRVHLFLQLLSSALIPLRQPLYRHLQSQLLIPRFHTQEIRATPSPWMLPTPSLLSRSSQL